LEFRRVLFRSAGASRGPGGTAAARVPAPRRQRHLYKDVCKRERPALWQGRAFRTPSPNPGGPAHGSAVVLTEVVLLQRHGLAGARAEGVVGRRTVVAADGVHRGLRLLGRLDPDVPVLGHARAG